MSLEGLIGDECGTTNSLVQLANHAFQDIGRQDEGLQHPFQTVSNTPDETTLRFQNMEPTFNMDVMLARMRETEDEMMKACNEEQSTQRRELQPQFQPYREQRLQPVNPWVKDFVAFQTDLDKFQNTPVLEDVPFPTFQDFYQRIPPQIALQAGSAYQNYQNREEFIHAQRRMLDLEPRIICPDEIRELAGEIINVTSKDSAQFADSKFVDFMQHLKKEGKVSETAAASAEDAAQDAFSKELWAKLTERWEKLNAGENSFDMDFEKYVAAAQSYKFAEDNPMMEESDALEEGKKKLADGDLPSAVMCFEAAVKQHPDNPEAWLLLGTSQAENEQDPQAIEALRKCIQLDRSNLPALMELAVCYTNENYYHQACLALKEWILKNPKYQDAQQVSSEQGERNVERNFHSLLEREFFEGVLKTFVAASEKLDADLDVDLQNGLGVLHALNGDHVKAAEYFRAAVKINKKDARLWNRLGATLANGDNAIEAVNAYRNAIHIFPRFIRARYNLGITCIHLKSYKAAGEHLVTALYHQNAGKGMKGEKYNYAMSDSIWSTLRLACAMGDRKDLFEQIQNRNLEALMKAFLVRN